MKKDNVIDITERVTGPDYKARLRGLKVRLDLEHAKIAVSTSLLSIVLLVTLANNNLLVSPAHSTTQASNMDLSSVRGIASVTNAAMDAIPSAEANAKLVADMAKHTLSSAASVGRTPSTVEKLAFGLLEGKYAIHMLDGKISEIEYNLGASGDAKRIDDVNAFLETQRDLLPVAFDKSLKVGSDKQGGDKLETYELVNRYSMPLAKVQVKTDADGRLLTMKVASLQVAAK